MAFKMERQFVEIANDQLGTEWMWESSPEIALVVVDDLTEAIDLSPANLKYFIDGVHMLLR